MGKESQNIGRKLTNEEIKKQFFKVMFNQKSYLRQQLSIYKRYMKY